MNKNEIIEAIKNDDFAIYIICLNYDLNEEFQVTHGDVETAILSNQCDTIMEKYLNITYGIEFSEESNGYKIVNAICKWIDYEISLDKIN